LASLVFNPFVFAQTEPSYEALIQQGNTQLKAGNADQALIVGQSAVRIDGDRWEGYALEGGALMNLKRNEEAADALSKAIDRAPEAKHAALRDLRRQCLISDPGNSTKPADTAPVTTTQVEVVLWKSIENSSNAADFQTYLSQYPQGVFSALAEQRLESARQKEAAERQAQLEQKQRILRDHAWTDLRTGLVWAREPSPSEFYDFSAVEGYQYCRHQNLAGFTDWRLPSLVELRHIYDPKVNAFGQHIMGGIHLSGPWLMGNGMDRYGNTWVAFRFDTGERGSGRYHFSFQAGGHYAFALCVRTMTRDETVALYLEATNKEPTNHLVNVARANVLLREGNSNEAIVSFKKDIAANPQSADAFAGWGNALLLLNDSAGAAEKFRKALEIDSRNGSAHSGLGEALQRQGNIVDAQAQYSNALELDPFDIVAYAGLGDIFIAKGDTSKAFDEYETATELDGSFARAWVGFGDVYRKRNKIKEAEDAYQRALREDPKNEQAARNLGALMGTVPSTPH